MERRPRRPRCDACGDDAGKACKDCGCAACGGKDAVNLIILCDECGRGYHTRCADPPLDAVPDDDWYCSSCRTDRSQVVGAGEKLKTSAKLAKTPAANARGKRDWGKGNATAGRSCDKTLDWIPTGFSGKIRGIEVGMTWKARIQLSGYKVHCPPVNGIHGRERGKDSRCFSIVLAGGYEDDKDEGDTVVFTGSGGRNLKDGNKRCAPQDSDQKLAQGNYSLAYACTGKLKPDIDKGEAKDWRKGQPIRVFRSSKGRRHSAYAPLEGIRYDGIYKVQKYWREKGKSKFFVYRFQLRRDDETPAPWTAKGKARIEKFGFNKVLDLKQSASEVWMQKFTPSEEERALIAEDAVNKAKWDSCLRILPCAEIDFLEEISKTFLCEICHGTVIEPVNAPCGHLTCSKCTAKELKSSTACATCRVDWGKEYRPVVNKNLKAALRVFLPELYTSC